MNTERFEELLSLLVDEDLTIEQGNELAAAMETHPDWVHRVREELKLADLLEQATQPGRQADAFMETWTTRMTAKETEEKFVIDLMPKIREVERKEARRRKLKPVMRGATALAAAAVFIAALAAPVFLLLKPRPVATVAASENAVWENAEENIEWEVGSPIMPGTPVRLRSGKVSVDFENGNRMTLEGPAELNIVSNSEAQLKGGKLLTRVRDNSEMFTIRAPSTDIQVQSGGSLGVRTLEGSDSVETTMLSGFGGATVGSNYGGSGIGPLESLVASQRKQGFAMVPHDLAPYRDSLSLLAGVLDHSPPVKVGLFGDRPAYGDPNSIQVVLEGEDIQLDQPLPVDVLPGVDAAPTRDGLHLQPRKPVRSYLVQLETPEGRKPKENNGFLDAYVTFDQPIVGISTSEHTLGISDSVAGYDIDGYVNTLNAPGRGLENEDSITIRDDGRTLDMRLKVDPRKTLGQIRVFVAAR